MASVGQVISSIEVSLDNFGPNMDARIVLLMFFSLSSKFDFEHLFVSKTMCFVGVILKNEHSAAEGDESNPTNHKKSVFGTP